MEDLMMMNSSSKSEKPITTSTNPIWKLYKNPSFISHNLRQFHHTHQIWDLNFIKPLIMESELELAKTQIMDLKSELEFERKIRQRMDLVNKKLVREIIEERGKTEAIQRLCEDFKRKISSDKSEMEKMKKEIEKERKMMKLAEVLREERVQMKLSEAKVLLEEKLVELQALKQRQQIFTPAPLIPKTTKQSNQMHYRNRLILGEKIACNVDDISNNGVFLYKKVSPESENHHIKRGIKGFVEFPRVVKTIGSRNKHLGTKLECQKAQLRILLKQRSPN